MTGESLPVDKAAGDEVSSGTVNQFGAFDMRAAKVGEDSSIQRMIRLVQSADAGKAKIVRTGRPVGHLDCGDRFDCGGADLADHRAELIRAVTILVVFCPCALVLATPTAIMAAIGNATKHGFLVREGDALERLAVGRPKSPLTRRERLPYGTPRVDGSAVASGGSGLPQKQLYACAAAAEQRSEHPLGKAVLRCYREESATDAAPGGAVSNAAWAGRPCSWLGAETLLAGNAGTAGGETEHPSAPVQSRHAGIWSRAAPSSIWRWTDMPAGFLGAVGHPASTEPPG